MKQSRPLLAAVLLAAHLGACSEEIVCHLCYMVGCFEGPYSNCTTVKLHGCSKVDVKLPNGLVRTLAKGCYDPGSTVEDPTRDNCVAKSPHDGLYTVHRCYRCDTDFCNGSSPLPGRLLLPLLVFLICD